MSDEQRKDEESEVEAHRHEIRRSDPLASDEPGDEAGFDDDVEAHRLEVRRPDSGN